MASKKVKAAEKVAGRGAQSGQALIEALKDNPYVQRILEDEDLRTQLRDTVDSSRAAYKRASKSKRPVQALASDKKLQKELRSAFENAKGAQAAFREGPVKQRGGRLKFVAIAVIGAGVALVASSGLRDKVLDLLFGPEETFDYVPAANGNGTAAAAPQTTTSNAS